MSLTFIDFFAGIGGFRRGMELAGHKCIGFCEFDKYAVMSYTMMHLVTEEQIRYIESIPAPLKKDGNRNLNKRQKELLREEYRNGEWYANDITTVDAGSMPRADMWLFGAPCQDFSIAGERKGLEGDRSSLVREVFRLIRELREEDRPQYIIYENVKGMLSSNHGWDFACILVEMESLGYDIEYQLFNSKDFGVPQNRERVYVVGHLRNRGEQKVFPIERPNAENSIDQIGNFMPTATRENPNQGRIYDAEGMAPCLNKMDGGGREPYVAIMGNVNPSGNGMNGNVYDATKLSPTLTTNKGEGNKIAIMAEIHEDIYLPGKNYNQRKTVHPANGISRTLIGGHAGNEPKVALPVLTPDRAEKQQNGRRFKENGEPMFTLTSQDRHGVAIGGIYTKQSPEFRRPPLENLSRTLKSETHDAGVIIPVCAEGEQRKPEDGIYIYLMDDKGEVICVYAIWSEKHNCYMVIRRLTPKECFRLQAWDDRYFYLAELVNSDSQLYKQAGNGITVSVAWAIGEKLS